MRKHRFAGICKNCEKFKRLTRYGASICFNCANPQRRFKKHDKTINESYVQIRKCFIIKK